MQKQIEETHIAEVELALVFSHKYLDIHLNHIFSWSVFTVLTATFQAATCFLCSQHAVPVS